MEGQGRFSNKPSVKAPKVDKVDSAKTKGSKVLDISSIHEILDDPQTLIKPVRKEFLISADENLLHQFDLRRGKSSRNRVFAELMKLYVMPNK